MKLTQLGKFFVFFLISSTCFSQVKKCPTGEITHRSAPSDTQLKRLMNQKKLDNNSNARIGEDEVVRIPVVVHVIHNNVNDIIGGSTNTNISDEQIFSQIKVLNEDFRKAVDTPGFNTSPVGADMKLEFYLTNIDPNGIPTTGILRTYSVKSQWDIIRERRELTSTSPVWDPNRFLNIWVVNLSGTFLGFAEFPGAPVDGLDLEDPEEALDGVIIDYKYFGDQTGTAIDGPYTYGRTTTHEIGHWLGLIHTWGDSRCGTDYCDDTPEIEGENTSISCFGYNSRCTGNPVPAMIENYMDYSADQCMNIFTQDQKTRARSILELSQRRRRLVLYSQSLLPPSDNLEVRLLDHPNDKTNLKLQVLVPGFKSFSISFYDMLGRPREQKDYRDYPSTVIPFTEFPRLVGGQMYIMQVRMDNELITRRVLVF